MDTLDPDFPVLSPEEASDAESLAVALRGFLDAAAAIGTDRALVAELVADLRQLTERLSPAAVDESKALWRKAPRDRPPALLPHFTFRTDGERLEGTVRFGRFHVGRLAAHGGAISLLFDEILGALVVSGGRGTARTAYLHVDFRALVPIGTDLRLTGWFSREDGRKRFVRAQMHHGETLCAEAEGLWVAPRTAAA